MNISELAKHLPENFSEAELLKGVLRLVGPNLSKGISADEIDDISHIFTTLSEYMNLKQECDDLFSKLDVGA